MTVKHVHTNITGGQDRPAIITMRLADSPDESAAKVSVEFTLPLGSLPVAGVPEPAPGSALHAKFQIAALQYVRDALAAEIERMSARAGHSTDKTH